jgi:hypothetical protein
MGVIIPVGFGLAKVKWTVGAAGEEKIITWGFDGDVAEDPTVDAAEIGAILEATNRPAKPAEYSNKWWFKGVDVTRMTSTGPIQGTYPRSVGGTDAAPPPPVNVAFLLQKHTARGGRMGRGRCFLPPIWTDESNVDAGGVITSFDLSLMQALWTNALTDLLASDCPPVLLHADGSTPDPITSWTISDVVATQRRRLRR